MNAWTKRSLAGLIGLILLPAVVSVANAAQPAPRADSTKAAPIASRDLAHAQTIRSETTARYARPHGPQLAVTESSSTGVVESFWLLSADLVEELIVPADNGVYYAICPRGATCLRPVRRRGTC